MFSSAAMDFRPVVITVTGMATSRRPIPRKTKAHENMPAIFVFLVSGFTREGKLNTNLGKEHLPVRDLTVRRMTNFL